MDAALLPRPPTSRIIVRRTFIEEVHSPRGLATLRTRACSDSALYQMGEEEERRKEARQQASYSAPTRQTSCSTTASGATEVEFELRGLSDTETALEEIDSENAELPCYAHLSQLAGNVADCAEDPAPDVQLVDPTPDRDLDAGYMPTFASVFGVPPAAMQVPATRAVDCALGSDSGNEAGGLAPGGSYGHGAAQLPQDFERLMQENQRLAFENQMLREYYMPIPEGFGTQEAPTSSGVAMAPGSWVFPLGMVTMPMGVCTMQPSDAPEAAQGVATRAPHPRQRGGKASAGTRAAAGGAKGQARCAKAPESRCSDDVTPVPEHLRTTVMLRNLPNNYSRAMLLALLDEEGFASKYDFLYLPIDFKSKACLGYAFINLTDPSVVPAFWRKFEGFSNWILPSKKVCHVSWSGPHQGLEDHIERYRNSPVMHASVVDEYKPLILQGGVQVPFPEPTKFTRAPRIRLKPSSAGGLRAALEAGAPAATLP